MLACCVLALQHLGQGEARSKASVILGLIVRMIGSNIKGKYWKCSKKVDLV